MSDMGQLLSSLERSTWEAGGWGKKEDKGWMCFFSSRVNQYKYFMLLCQKRRFKLKDCRSRLTLALNESSEEKQEMPVKG